MLVLLALVAIMQHAASTYIGTLYPELGSPSGCWGILIASRHVLTSAHCLPLSLKWATIGSESRLVVDAVAHPQFDQITRAYDLAVVKLNRQSNQQTARLRWTPVNEATIAVAWVKTTMDKAYLMSMLPNCTSMGRNDPSVVCARTTDATATCFVNSGAPLEVAGQVVGVTGVGCLSRVAEDISTRLMCASIASSRSFLEGFLSDDANLEDDDSDVRPSRVPIVESVDDDEGSSEQ